MINNLLLASIWLPFIGSFFCLVLRDKARETWAIITVVGSLILSCALIPAVIGSQIPFHMETGQSILIQPFRFGTPLFNISFELDRISLVFALLFSFIGLISLIYSINYIKNEKSEYYFVTTLLIGSLMGVSYANNLILLYIFWELSAFTTWRLVGSIRKPELTKIANKTFLMTYLGSSLMLFGFIFIYLQKGVLDLNLLIGETLDHSSQIFNLIFIGLIAKSAFLPIYTWPSAAYPAAPSSSSALLSGIVSKIGLLAFAKIFVCTFYLSWTWILFLAVGSSIIAGGAALVSTDIKKIIAYSSISQIAYILMGFGILSEIGIQSALLYSVIHGIGKAGLFFGAGILEQETRDMDIRKLGGFMKLSPATGVGFLFCIASIAGLPPFGGFWAKLGVIIGLVETGHLLVAGLVIFSAMLTLFYTFRLFNGIFLGESQIKGRIKTSKTMVSCVLGLGIISLLLGIFISKFWLFVS
ncbi:MAG: proton-conducting transporter membrane subunit [bacterium]|nr:proton-conducting transporter membrane subunit [bacterium]